MITALEQTWHGMTGSQIDTILICLFAVHWIIYAVIGLSVLYTITKPTVMTNPWKTKEDAA